MQIQQVPELRLTPTEGDLIEEEVQRIFWDVEVGNVGFVDNDLRPHESATIRAELFESLQDHGPWTIG